MYALMPFERDRTVGRLWREAEGIFERLSGGEALPEPVGKYEFAPKVDIKQNEAGYEVLADVPGIKAEDLDVTFQDGVLTIKGERRVERRGAGEN